MGISSAGYWTFYKGYGAASDRSLKGDPQDASTEDCRTSAKTYERLDLPDSGSRLGCIAQDVEAACPSPGEANRQLSSYKRKSELSFPLKGKQSSLFL